MPSLTHLHETSCRWNQVSLSQADVLEGLAQLMNTRLGNVVRELLQSIQHEVLLSLFGLNEKQSQKLQRSAYIQKLNGLSFAILQHSGQLFFAPTLRQIIEKFPNLQSKQLTPSLTFLVGALNGVIGDYLLETQNPLALPMMFYDHYGMRQQGMLSGRIVIFIHGLCMNHLDWCNSQLGEKLLAQRDQNTMLYLSYNSGRRVSANGRDLAHLLQTLIEQNPEIRSIDLIGHSMGGLIARSALFYGKQNLQPWMYLVENLICIATPHHGAALERFSFALQKKLGHFPIIKIVGYLMNIRSNGILDLRYGSIRDDDWEFADVRIGLMDDHRKPAPLPVHIQTFFIAGTIEDENKNSKTRKIIGDYLVSLKSALGQHPHPRFQLKLAESHKAIFYGLNHFEIHHHPMVAEQIVKWLYAPQQQSNQLNEKIQTYISQ